MGLSRLRWRGYVLVGGVLLLLLVTFVATWLTTVVEWAHLVAVPAAGLALVVGAVAVVALARWVEMSRERVLRENRTTQQLVRLREAERIAQELGATTVRDLFGISLALQSAAARHPSAAPALRAVTADVDRVLTEIRSHVFNGQRSVADVLAALDPELPASPKVSGRVDLPASLALETFLRELLPQFPAAVEIVVSTPGGELSVLVTGTAPDDPTTLKETAADHGATAAFEPDHLTVEWPSTIRNRPTGRTLLR